MKRQEVLLGNSLQDTVQYSDDRARFSFVGVDGVGKRAHFPIGDDLLSKHILFLGGIGTGKSNAFYHLTRSLRAGLTERDVMIIFDTKGDFYREFYRPGDIVISNDRRACGPSGPDYWNLFREVLVDDRLEENVQEICKTIFADKLEKTSQPFFPNAAKDILGAMMLHLCRTPDLEKYRNNQSLRELLNSFDVGSMLNILAAHADLRSMAAYIQDPRSGQTLGVVAELQQAVREVFIGAFRQKGALSLRELVRRKGGQVVFIEYDLSIGGVLSPIYRLMFDLAIKEALSRQENEGNVYFLIDEFRLIPNLQHIDDGVNFGRSLGVKFAIGVQNIEQIYHAYEEELARSILSGFSTNIVFRITDTATREYVKELFGKNATMVSYMASVQTKGLSEQLRESNAVEDWDILNLATGQAIIGAPATQPFRFQFSRYESTGATK